MEMRSPNLAKHRPTLFIIIGSLLLVIYIVFLLVFNYRNNMALHESSLKRFQLDIEKHAKTLEYYFLERIYDTRTLADSVEVQSYFVNHAMGMTEQYGLKVSLFIINKLMEKIIQSNTINGDPIYKTFALSDHSGALLVKTGTKPPQDDELYVTELVKQVSKEPQAVLNKNGDGYEIILVSPCFFKKKRVGWILAWLDLNSLYKNFLRSSAKMSSKCFDLILKNGVPIRFSDDTCAKSLLENAREILSGIKNMEIVSVAHPHNQALQIMVTRTQIQTLPLFLTAMIDSKEIMPNLKGWQFLAGTGALILLILLGLSLVVRTRTKNLILEARYQESERQHSALQKANKQLAETQNSLLEASRTAGMAEVATGVLHNVGNVLNSVNVSCTVIINQLRESRVKNISKLANLLAEKKEDLGRFFTEDSRGLQVPEYLFALSSAMEDEHQLLTKEAMALFDRIEHIKGIVTMQQTYGRVSGVLETLPPKRLMEDALAINAGSLSENNITVERHYDSVPDITVDKHKVLQILLNLINNAMHACCEQHAHTETESSKRIISLHIFRSGKNRISIQVSDNGVGIPKENLIKIFQHGFTTRKTGHGFGLHSGALAAKELDGSLNAQSEGIGCGATFVLELPCDTKTGSKR